METLYQISDQQQKHIDYLLDIFIRNGFKSQKLPLIYWSDDIPTILVNGRNLNLDKELIEYIDGLLHNKKLMVDNLLGIYRLKNGPKHEGEIILYKKSIEHCAQKLFPLSADSEVANQHYTNELCLVVLLHEVGHWIAHWLQDMNGNRWLNMEYEGCEDFHEGWAQLMVWWASYENPSLRQDFEKLVEYQPEIYKGYKELTDYDKIKIIVNFVPCRVVNKIGLWDFIKFDTNRRGEVAANKLGLL